MKQNGRKGGTDWLAELQRDARADVVRSSETALGPPSARH